MTTFKIGNLEVARVEDFTDHGVPLKMLLPELDDATIAENLDWLAPRFLNPENNTISVPIQSWLLRTRHHTILVDTCVGHQKKRHFPPFNMRDSAYLDNLKAAGFAPDEIDYVFCTHLHSDHVGWNTKQDNGRWVPTFPKARYLFSRKDYDAFDPRRQDWPHYGGTDEDTFLDSVLPVVEAGQVEFVDGEHRVGDGLHPALPWPFAWTHGAARGRFRRQRAVHRRFHASSDPDRRHAPQQFHLLGRRSGPRLAAQTAGRMLRASSFARARPFRRPALRARFAEGLDVPV